MICPILLQWFPMFHMSQSLPGLVNVYILQWKDPPFCSWENPLNFYGPIFHCFFYVHQRVPTVAGFRNHRRFTHVDPAAADPHVPPPPHSHQPRKPHLGCTLPQLPSAPDASWLLQLLPFSDSSSTVIWVCLKIGYIPNYSHLIGIMISKTIGFRGTLFSDTPICHSTKTTSWKRLLRLERIKT